MRCQRYEFPWRLLDSLAQLGNGLDTLLKEECSSSYSLSSTYSSTILETAIRTVHPCTQMDIRVLYDTEVGMTHEFIRFGETNFMGVNTTNKVSSYVLKDAGPNQTISLLSSSKILRVNTIKYPIYIGLEQLLRQQPSGIARHRVFQLPS